MAPPLKSISLTDFRSIRGTVNIPLEAPIVLIHGQNGVGKTSLLSGIELVLTGSVESLRRSDSSYRSYLVHKESEEARIALSFGGSDGPITRELTIRDGVVVGSHLLGDADSSFFTERCYLAQATMARLLELYQGKESNNGDSALTKFVKDLLGLDQLDFLIEGLRDAGHVSRIKNALPEYRDILDRLPILKSRLQKLSSERDKLTNEAQIVDQGLAEALVLLGQQYTEAMSASEIELIANEATDVKELQRIALLRRNLKAARDQWQGIKNALSGAAIDDAERDASVASGELNIWRNGDGQRIERALVSINTIFPDLPDPASVGFQRAIQYTLQTISRELQRSSDLLKKDSEASTQIAALDEQLQKAQSRLAVLDQQIAGHLANADQLAKALSALLPFANDPICPVCGRDFREVSSDSLHSHLSSRVSTLIESAGRLQSFIKDRSDALRLYGDATRTRDGMTADQLDAAARTALSLRVAELIEREQVLTNLIPSAADGDQRIAVFNKISRVVSDLRSKNEQAIGFRARLRDFEEALGLAPMQESEPTELALERFETILGDLDRRHSRAQQVRGQVRENLQERSRQRAQRAEIDRTIRSATTQVNTLEEELRAFDITIKEARELAKIARIVRSDIVRKVFDNTLNALWRDLFIRLAPNESFVPAFALPEKAGGVVEAILETHHRSGGRGGNPRAMLSAGNLNTAALTLFLALHLSVANRLPCLIIDDPFQSMDEVHIAQLAALLRTLSRQHGRQIVIAVHEKPLFDYLALELSPASPEDRLITIELGTAADGNTVPDAHVISFTPDKAVMAA